MIERWSDRSTGFNIPSMGQREQATWTNFTMHLGILDTFHMDASRQIGTKRFTWKNQNRTPNWSRIDRFYTSYELHEQEEITWHLATNCIYIGPLGRIPLSPLCGEEEAPKGSLWPKARCKSKRKIHEGMQRRNEQYRPQNPRRVNRNGTATNTTG